ncbi:MAG: hydroxysqualene dehydroxylase HpnE [Acidobacteriota bacterium]
MAARDAWDVVVIGAGCAGLSAATALTDRGARVLVVEARPGLGGRATAFRDPRSGEIVDNGQHVLFGCYGETLAFLRRIGASDRVRWQSGLAVPMIDRRGVSTTLLMPGLPPPLQLVAGVLAWEALSWRERLSLAGVAPALAGIADRRAADETVAAWLARRGQSPRLVELLWEPLAVAALNQSIHEAAAAPFLEVLRRMFASGADGATMVLPARPLDELYAVPAADWLAARGSAVRTQAPARIVVEDGAVRGVHVRGERIDAPVVISTVPWFGLEDLFEEPPAALGGVLAAAAATGSVPIVTVNLWFDRPVVDAAFVGLPGRTFQWVFDKRAIFGADASHLSLVASAAAAVAPHTNDDLVALALDEMRAALPDVRRATLRASTAVRERRATFSLAPGQPPRPGPETPIRGFILAGDWIDTGLPATIEGAVVSGHRAAALA